VPNGTLKHAAWDSIPFAGDANYNLRAYDRWPYVTFDGSADIGTSEVTDLGASHYADYVGDICRYISSTQSLGGSYRLPRSEEYASIAYNLVGTFFFTCQYTDASGTYPISIGIQLGNGVSVNFFPDSGNRGQYDSAGALLDMDRDNYYQTSTVFNIYGGYIMNFIVPTSFHPHQWGSRILAGPVRCVLE
ncbi:MAG: hypothetical protein LBS46_05040, partial [Dysgonamonadaceae bacterium]|jgi:hypothetical protein|nr:hypothetical protein [Dysgonamonadaceae bacterium]